MHARAGNLDRAIGHLEVALQLAPDDPTVSVQLGVLEQRRGNLPDAYVAFRRASQIDPENLEAVSGLALSAEALGFEEEANDAYARWAEIERERGIEN
jgi:Flp pilus assembly protein TadD